MSATAMTQTEMVTEVANIIGRDQTSVSADQVTTYEDRIKQWLYWGHLTIARAYAFPELDYDPVDYALTAGAANYSYTFTAVFGATIATRIRQVLGVVLINGTSSQRLDQLLSRRFEQDHPYVEGDATGTPEQYSIYGRRFEFWRAPVSAYSARFRVNLLPANFTSSSAASNYINKDDVIIAAAVVHAYISLQEIEDAKSWAETFMGRLKSAVGHELEPGDWEPEGRAFDFNSQRSSLDSHADPFQFFNR